MSAARPAQDCLVRLAQLGGCGDQRIVNVALFPVDLVHGPRGDWRLRKRADLRAIRARVLGKRVACRGELVGRQLVQAIDVGVESAGRQAGYFTAKVGE